MRVVRQISVLLILVCFIVACAGPQTVKPYKAVKVVAETVLYDARILMNQGDMPAAEFNQIRNIYDKLADAQNKVIGARKALITYNTTETKDKLDVAILESTNLLIELLRLAKNYGIDVGGGE